MTLRLAVLTLAVLPSAVACARAGAESRHGGRTAGEWVAALADDDAWNVGKAITHLAAMGPAAVPALIAAASHADARVRLGAARALGETGGPGAAGTLARMAERDAAFSNRLHAALGLSQLSAAGDREARDALAALVAALAAALESADSEAAADAGGLLGSIGEPARGTLMAKLTHPRPEVRIRAIREIDSFRTGVMPALAKAADDPEAQVRAAAVGSLAMLVIRDAPDKAAAIAVIKSKLKDPDPSVRTAASTALETATAR